jgi:hypothetical protein
MKWTDVAPGSPGALIEYVNTEHRHRCVTRARLGRTPVPETVAEEAWQDVLLTFWRLGTTADEFNDATHCKARTLGAYRRSLVYTFTNLRRWFVANRSEPNGPRVLALFTDREFEDSAFSDLFIPDDNDSPIPTHEPSSFVVRLLDQLTPSQRDALDTMVLRDLTQSEAAIALGLEPTTQTANRIGAHKSAALKRARRLIDSGAFAVPNQPQLESVA